jgi:hypothetical protein
MHATYKKWADIPQADRAALKWTGGVTGTATRST